MALSQASNKLWRFLAEMKISFTIGDFRAMVWYGKNSLSASP